jgi:copper chaperone CopZ
MSKIVKSKLKIEGMHCTSCAMTIDLDLEELEGIHGVKTHYAREETEVEFDEEKINIAQILEQVEKTGYKAIVVKQLIEDQEFETSK